jgi:hypothetical protein
MNGLHRALEAIQQKSEDLFAFEVEGIEVVFRLPTVHQAQQYAMLLGIAQTESDRLQIYETMFRGAIQDDWMANKDGELRAGLPETVARLIFRLSGLDEASIPYTEELFALYRQQSNSTVSYMKRMICMVFPGYTFESLGQLNYQNLVNVFIQAEPILLKQGIIETEHDFKSAANVKAAPFAVEDQIKRDRDAQREYDLGDQEDPRKLAYMQKLRDGARKRAEIEERKYKQRYVQQQ